MDIVAYILYSCIYFSVDLIYIKKNGVAQGQWHAENAKLLLLLVDRLTIMQY